VKYLISLVFCFASFGQIKAQNDSVRTDNLLSFKGYISSISKNFSKQATAPFHLKGKEYIEAAAIIGTTLALTTLDGKADDAVKDLRDKSSFVHNVSPVVTELGATYGIAGVSALALGGLIFNNTDMAETGLLATQAIITSGVWAQVGKFISGRERPFQSYVGTQLPGGKWYGGLVAISNPDNLPASSFNSFPSGHTTTAFAIATVFAMKYKNCKAVPVTAYTLATIVGATRMIEHKHWLSDVFAGAVLGHLCARQVMNSYLGEGKISSKSKNHSSIFIYPDMTNGLGITCRIGL